MVLGLFEGSIDVATDRATYSRGDTINCSCTLKLKQSVEARALRVKFLRIEGSGKHTRYIELARKDLGPARTYRDGERFEFSLLVDEMAAPDIVKYGGLTGTIWNILSSQSVRWAIRVALDMPIKLDVSGSIRPVINRPIVQK